MSLCLSDILRRFGSDEAQSFELESDEGVLQIWETGLMNAKINADGFVPLTKEGSKGIRTKVRK